MDKKYYIIFGVLALIIVLFIVILFNINTDEEEVEDNSNYSSVYMYDLGNSNITFIKKDDFNIMIGTGSFDDQEELLKVITKLDITHIDYLIIPNLEDDSIGNIGFLINNYDIDYLYMSEKELDSEEFEYAINNNYINQIVLTSDEIIEYNGLTINIYVDSKNNYSFQILDNDKRIFIVDRVEEINDTFTNCDLLVFDDDSLIKDISFSNYIYDGNESIDVDSTEISRNVLFKLKEKSFVIEKNFK